MNQRKTGGLPETISHRPETMSDLPETTNDPAVTAGDLPEICFKSPAADR